MRTTLFFSLTAALIAAAPASAAPAPASENAVSVEVVTDDLDLSD